MPVQAVEPRAQRQVAEPHLFLAEHAAGVRIDEHRLLGVGTEPRIGERDPGGVAWSWSGSQPRHRQVGDACLGGGGLCQQRKRFTDRLDGQQVSVDEALDGPSHRIEGPGDRRDQDEWCDEHARVEVQAADQGKDCAPW
ncbi:MAG: hypothetical protein QOK12_423 [Mycobacterium sp.]|jgi:hypothetical protein|nr:hypothetical protein [Mycobacterium sp.]